MLLFGRLEGIADLQLSLIIGIEVIPNHSVELIFVIVLNFLLVLFVNLRGLNLEGRLDFSTGPQDSGLLLHLVLDNTEEEVNYTHRIQLLVIIEVDKP